MREELRSPLQQPEGFVGEQVSWFNQDGTLESAQILCRDPESTAYLSVFLPGGKNMPDFILEEDLISWTPSLEVGWETELSSDTIVQQVMKALPERKIKDYHVVPPTVDARYFTEKDNPYFTSNLEVVLKVERTGIAMYFSEPDELVGWGDEPEVGLYPLNVNFKTQQPYDEVEGQIHNLVEYTARPDKRDAIYQALELQKQFYKNYVEIDFMSVTA